MDVGNLNSISQQSIIDQESSIDSLSKQINKFQSQTSGVQKNFNEQFKEIAQQTTDELQSHDQTEISRFASRDIKQQRIQSYKQLQNVSDLQIKEVPKEAAKTGPHQLTPFLEQMNRLNKIKADQQKNLQQKLLGEKGKSVLDPIVMSSQGLLFSKWLKKLIGKKDHLENSDEDISIENPTTEGVQNPTQRTENQKAAAARQRQLFSMNLNASIQFLSNLKSFNKRFSPNMLIYDEENGYVDGEKTLETLGWQSVNKVKNFLFKQLSVNQLKKINQLQEILNRAKEEGIDLFKGHHPVLNQPQALIALEKLTGDITVLNGIDELTKLFLSDDILQVREIAQ